jgi:hypothetical protein
MIIDKGELGEGSESLDQAKKQSMSISSIFPVLSKMWLLFLLSPLKTTQLSFFPTTNSQKTDSPLWEISGKFSGKFS